MAKTAAETAVERTVQMELREDPCYLLGRYIAVTEWLDEQVNNNRGESAVMVDAFHRALRGPAAAYVRVAKIAHRRLAEVPESQAEEHGRLITSIGARIGDDLPGKMSDAESAAMSSGYWSQHAALLAAEVRVSREECEAAMAAVKTGAARLVAAGMSEVEAAQRLGINRMSVRAALGK